MARISLAGFRDPQRRPRFIIWTGVTALAIAALIIVALGVTSTRWFCSEGCHKVQDDTIIAYARSSHSEVSCLACHMPVNADPVTFALHKMKALGELFLTVTDKYELPLNARDELAESAEMSSDHCTQCHDLTHRSVSPGPGIRIDHQAHAGRGIQCTMCHNRVAHKEDSTLTLPGNRKHEDFMTMDACFRCHTLSKRRTGKYKAPGTCSACHTKGFDLRPVSHDASGFFTPNGPSAGHALLAKARPTYCEMCHDRSTFCDACHGVEMPHPEGFRNSHGALAKAKPKLCLNCHKTESCNECHHQGSDPTRTWTSQHPEIVARVQGGAEVCFGECHDRTFCPKCHIRVIK